MKRMLFNAAYHEELRVATVDGQKLVDFDIETSSKAQRRGNIYKGVVTRVEPSLEACFVDYGTEKQGFLPFKEIDLHNLPNHIRENGGVNKLTVGTEFIIQVEKDERGNKGAALTTRISLPGRYLVLMPGNARSGGISRRIDGEERDELKSVLSNLSTPDNMSVIARTAALGRVQEELQWDLDYLLKLWAAIKTAASNNSGSFLIYQESNLVVRSIRDHFSPDITEILIDSEEIFEQARLFISHVIPNFANRVKLYNDDVPLFSRFQIEHQIESAYSRVVNLPSGGAIVIDNTEALTAIDVNSARANKGSDIEATALATNLEAADEIARQLRLRDLGGLVVVDFIDMENSKNQREVENFFKEQLNFDRARIQMGKLSRFGLLELSRQRLQSSLEESTTIQCPRCNGVGSIRGIESNALHILRLIQEEAVKNAKYLSALHVQLPVPVATYLLNEKRDEVAKIETRMKVRIMLIPNLHLESPDYKIKKVSSEHAEQYNRTASFELVDRNQDIEFEPSNKVGGINKALVKNIAPSEKAPVINNSIFGSIVAKISDLFKKSVEKNTSQAKTPKNRVLVKNMHNPKAVPNTNNVNKPRQPRQANSAAGTPHNNKTQTNNRPPRNNQPKAPKNVEPQNNQPHANHKPHENKLHETKPTVENKAVMEKAETVSNTNRGNTVVEPNIRKEAERFEPSNVNKASAPIMAHKPIANKAPVASSTAINAITETKAVASKPTEIIVAKTTYIEEKVDLGELQMVGTDAALATQMKEQTITLNMNQNVKRYSDVVAQNETTTPQHQTVEFEMVETHK